MNSHALKIAFRRNAQTRGWTAFRLRLQAALGIAISDSDLIPADESVNFNSTLLETVELLFREGKLLRRSNLSIESAEHAFRDWVLANLRDEECLVYMFNNEDFTFMVDPFSLADALLKVVLFDGDTVWASLRSCRKGLGIDLYYCGKEARFTVDTWDLDAQG